MSVSVSSIGEKHTVVKTNQSSILYRNDIPIALKQEGFVAVSNDIGAESMNVLPLFTGILDAVSVPQDHLNTMVATS